MTQLFAACEVGFPPVVSYLMTLSQINVNKPVTNKLYNNATPLWVASMKGHAEVVTFLLQQKDIQTKVAGCATQGGFNRPEEPAKVAERLGHFTIISIFRVFEQKSNFSQDFLNSAEDYIDHLDTETLAEDNKSAFTGVARDDVVQNLLRENMILREQLKQLQLQLELSTKGIHNGYNLHKTASNETLATLQTQDDTQNINQKNGDLTHAKF